MRVGKTLIGGTTVDNVVSSRSGVSELYGTVISISSYHSLCMNSKVAYLVQDGATTDVTRSYRCSRAKVSVSYFVVEDATEVNLFEEKQSG